MIVSNPIVSVIVPVHNAEKYLEQCLESILGQTLGDIEVICVNDRSTDGSAVILDSFAEKDPRLSVLQSPGLGAGGARNIGLRAAKGKYLSFLDADDFFEPDMLEATVEQAERDNSDIVVYGSWVYDTVKQSNRQAKWRLQVDRLPPECPFKPSDISDRLFDVFGNDAWNKLFRASPIRENDLLFQEISRTNDLFFTCKALTRARLISVIDRCFAHYRVATKTSLQSTNDRDPLSFLKAYDALYSYLESRDLLPQYEDTFVNHLVDGICTNVSSVHTMDSVSLIKEAVVASIEPKHRILGQRRELVRSEAQLAEYESLIKDDIPTFLFKQTVSLRAKLEDSYWYADWCDWKRWALENEANEHREQIEELRQDLAERERELDDLKATFAVRARNKVLAAKAHLSRQ